MPLKFATGFCELFALEMVVLISLLIFLFRYFYLLIAHELLQKAQYFNFPETREINHPIY